MTRDSDDPRPSHTTGVQSTPKTSGVNASLRAPSRGPLAPPHAARGEDRLPDVVADVLLFMQKMGMEYGGLPRALPDDGEDRISHILEEVEELRVSHVALQLAVQAGRPDDVADHLEGCLDALVDVVYTTIGTAVKMGFVHSSRSRVPGPLTAQPSKFERAWARVQAANVAKERAPGAAGHKAGVVKPPGWRAPRHADLVVPNTYTGEG